MSFAYPGLTHCKECGTTLGETETYRCRNCQAIYEKEESERQLKIMIQEMIANELAKQTQKIEELIIVVNGQEQQYFGYWKDNKFYTVR